MRVDNVSDSSQICRMQQPASETRPYLTLMRHKRWATHDLNAVLADNLGRLPDFDRGVVLQVLDHIQAVDAIFRCNLEGRDHGRTAPRSDAVPTFEALAGAADAMSDWYADYAASASSADIDRSVEFRFSSGAPARMTRGEMLLHVSTHGAYHRGNVGILLQKNGIAPNPDRMTDFLEASRPTTLERTNACPVSR